MTIDGKLHVYEVRPCDGGDKCVIVEQRVKIVKRDRWGHETGYDLSDDPDHDMHIHTDDLDELIRAIRVTREEVEADAE